MLFEDMSNSPKTILNHEEIKRRREAIKIEGKPMTQEQAAGRAGFKSRQHWNEIEQGRSPSVTLTTLAKIAGAIECEPRDLLVKPAKKNPKRRPALV